MQPLYETAARSNTKHDQPHLARLPVFLFTSDYNTTLLTLKFLFKIN
jgi:hypothetical protein